MSNLVPLYNKAIVEIIDEKAETKTDAGLILTASPTPFYRGKVTGVGCGHYQNAQRIPMDVEVGDIIVFLKQSGFGVEFDAVGNSTKIVLADTDIYAKETEDD